MTLTRSPLILENSATPQAAVILLHGLGADGNDFKEIVKLWLKTVPQIRFIMPHANVRPVTMNDSFPMPAWFDLFGLEEDSHQDEAGLQQAESWVNDLIDEQIAKGIPANKILVGGFSQGGALALYAGLRYSQKLGGILALSTYLPVAHALAEKTHFTQKDTPIFLAHGSQDVILPLSFGLKTKQYLENLGCPVNWRVYWELGHSLSFEEIQDLERFFHSSLILVR